MSEEHYKLEGQEYGISSRYQINENNKRRPKPTMKNELTPSGPICKEVMTQAANQKNAEIDRTNAFMEKRMARRKGRAKKNFNERSRNEWGHG